MTTAFLLATCGPAQSALLSFADDKSGFIAATGASSIGALPDLGSTAVTSRTIGGVTITTASGSLFFGDFSADVAGNEMIISGNEHFNVALPAGTFSFGLDIYEPTFAGGSGCNTTACFDTSFSIEILDGSTSLGIFTYNAPDDTNAAEPSGPVGFFGVHSSSAFNTIRVRDMTATIDNEMFANFLRGTSALVPPTPAPEPASLALVAAALAGLALARRRGGAD